MSIEAMKQMIELYDKHSYNNDHGGIEFSKRHGYKFTEAVEALRTAIQQAESGACKSFTELRERHREGVDAELAAMAAEAKTGEPVGYMNAGNIRELKQGELPYGYVYPQKEAGVSIPVYDHPDPGVPDGWRRVFESARNRLQDDEPSAFDNSGYRSYASNVLDGVEDELEAIDAAEELRTAIQQAESEPVVEPSARVELMKTGGNAGLSTRIIELDIATRERLRPGDLLYTHPAPGVPEDVVRDADRLDWLARNPVDALDVFGKSRPDEARFIRATIDAAMTAAQAQKGHQ